MERSVSQLLSVRREHNCTKLDVEELKHLWDITVAFIQVGGSASAHCGLRKRLAHKNHYVLARCRLRRAGLHEYADFRFAVCLIDA